MKKTLFLLSVLLMQTSFIMVFAQSKPKAGDLISGKVFDNEGPMMMVNVVERDSMDRIVAHGITDINGIFSFRLVDPEHSIQISYVGYGSVSIPIDTTYFEIKMKVRDDLPKVDITTAPDTIDMSKFEPLGITTVDEALTGRIADYNVLFNDVGASVIPPKFYFIDMSKSSKVMPKDPLNIEIPGVEFQVDINGSRQIVSLPKQYYSDIENGHGYVDLGLSVKWATCNIGADNPEEIGDRYAWGEVSTKPDYTWQNYRFNIGGEGFWDVGFSKYNSDSNLGRTDKYEVLEPQDDAAHENWGGKWRIPTAEEFQELANNCTFVWSTLNGREGCLIISNKPGYTDRFIFLPTTRKRSDGVGTADGYYWSSTLNQTNRQGSANPGPCNCYAFHIWDISYFEISLDLQNSRCWGLTVRPVCP